MKRRHRRNGFTLFETMVALSVLALGLTYLLGTFSRDLRAVRTTDSYVQALHLAQSLLAKHSSSREQRTGSSRGTYGKMSWAVFIRRTDAAGVPSSAKFGWEPFHISVKVSWPTDRQIVLETIKLGRRDARS